jgi:hypothetical protein
MHHAIIKLIETCAGRRESVETQIGLNRNKNVVTLLPSIR